MAVSPVVANTVEVRLLWSLAGQGAVNVLHATAAAGTVVNQALANTLGSAIKTAWTTNLGALSSTNSGLIRVGVRDLRVANSAEFLDTGGAVAGSGVGDALPPQVATCITLRTALSGKSFRGRVYLGGFIEAQNDAAGTALAALNTAAVAFITAVSNAMTTSQLTLAVTSKPHERTTIVRTVFHNDGTTSTKTLSDEKAKSGGSQPVTVIQARNNGWETQRRRNNSRGAVPTTLFAVAESHIGPAA